jgi:uncharacterized membrane protein YeiH
VVFFVAEALGANGRLCALAGAATIIALRLAALRLGWRLPVLEIKRSE